MVPPSTIMAAVGWRTWAIFPPSIISPARIPASARMMPPIVLSSTTESLRGTMWVRRLRLHDGRVDVGTPRRQSSQYRAPEIDDPENHVGGGLADDDLLPINKGDHRIGRVLHELDQIGVQRDGAAVQAC